MTTLRYGYASGTLSPSVVVNAIYDRISSCVDRRAWIHVVSKDEALRRARQLERTGGPAPPLYGLPFAVKDNFDVPGLPTSNGCPATTYVAQSTGPAVQRLIDAGAILIGKTNMDQFAIGLVGLRTPYGGCTNSFDARYISGGSSSGSAVAVATGLVSFALGNDAAGSGRVPAAFNNVVGLKPTPGLISNSCIS